MHQKKKNPLTFAEKIGVTVMCVVITACLVSVSAIFVLNTSFFKNKDFKNHLIEEKNDLNEFLNKKIFIQSLNDSIEIKNIEKQISNKRTFR
ncbi:MAG: hypothetical protein RSE07_03480, partial [Oscillospiraceae bacterium]